VSPAKYELGFYIPEDDILHSHRRENLKSYTNDLKLVNMVYTYVLTELLRLWTLSITLLCVWNIIFS
jgi:hypothetical protein